MAVVDGDKSLVISDPTIIQVAERNTCDVVPLFYNMAKAGCEEITPSSLYDGLVLAYTGGNIGVYSNDISKIFNSGVFESGSAEEQQQALQAVKILCMENNFVIDYAKTLYKPKRPSHISELLKQYITHKLPSFFMYAKDKERKQVIDWNNSTVNRLKMAIPKQNVRFNFKQSNLGKLDYTVLMNNKDIVIDDNVIDTYKSLCVECNQKMRDRMESNNYYYMFRQVRQKMFELEYSASDIVDMLVLYYFHLHKTTKKQILWNCFGDYIYKNIQNHVTDDFKMCVKCKKRFYSNDNRVKKCPKCSKKRAVHSKICENCGNRFEANARTKSNRCPACRVLANRERVARFRKIHNSVTT